MLRFGRWKILIIFLPCIWGVYNVVPHFFYSQVEKYNDVQAQIALGQLPENETLITDTPTWSHWAPSRIVNLGLDLRGGAHVLVEVSLEEVYSERLSSYWPDIRNSLRTIRKSVGSIKQVSGGINELLIEIGAQEGLLEAIDLVEKETRSIGVGGLKVSSKGENVIKISLGENER